MLTFISADGSRHYKTDMEKRKQASRNCDTTRTDVSNQRSVLNSLRDFSALTFPAVIPSNENENDALHFSYIECLQI